MEDGAREGLNERCFLAGNEMISKCANCDGSRECADEINCKGYIEYLEGKMIIRARKGEYIPLEELDRK